MEVQAWLISYTRYQQQQRVFVCLLVCLRIREPISIEEKKTLKQQK